MRNHPFCLDQSIIGQNAFSRIECLRSASQQDYLYSWVLIFVLSDNTILTSRNIFMPIARNFSSQRQVYGIFVESITKSITKTCYREYVNYRYGLLLIERDEPIFTQQTTAVSLSYTLYLILV
uniref:AlNc14C4G632 protein n=1 Tax=Albugo laibachii Nc14 TaxID=890382 RepID=F0W0J0_9STRA|nr:AlNc14C4G632 [Albugo laibachii Nc14]|eukprot:CCA14562.1 AlNc14C4G632 [Albugo laibachii Nc14]